MKRIQRIRTQNTELRTLLILYILFIPVLL